MKINDKVYFRNDPDKEVYRVYAIYSKNKISLGLLKYPDVEQDSLVNINNLSLK